ncbi:TonB family protein [Sphingobium sp. SYK-6]|uniref:TonB family protein n=1 Tax=Sphingobium sp. (strain NBRC 103272 / SYK-6) TaxID=627192 RepID=UPI0013149815|nr:TonB family protein [Sphingobium sp. SYK-6]
MVAALVASGMVLEPTSERQRWLDFSDYPSNELRQGRGGVAVVKVIIAPTGVPEQCLIVSSSGNEVINKIVCDLSMKRLRFKPPISETGKPTYGIWQRRAVMLPPGWTAALKPEETSNFKIRLDAPPSIRKSAEVRTIVSVDDSGNFLGCGTADIESDASLIENACDHIKRVWQPAPERNMAGNPITYVRWAQIEFIVH